LKKSAEYENRITRIKQAVALEHPDRTPVVLEYSGFAPLIMRTPVADFLGSPEKNLESRQCPQKMV